MFSLWAIEAMYKKNHFIPAFYLKQRYVPNKHVNSHFFSYEFDHTCKVFLPARAKNHGNATCFQEKLYWLDTKNKDLKISLEKLFSAREREVAKVFQKLKNNPTYEVTPVEHCQLLLFVLQLRIRAPHIVNPLKSEEKKKEAQAMVKLNFLKNGGTFYEYDCLTSISEIQDEINNLSIFVLEGEDFEKAANNWLIKTFKPDSTICLISTTASNYSLITSNFPVVAGRGIFSEEGYDIICPLSPTKLFCIVSQESLEALEAIKLRLKSPQGMDDLVINTNTGLLKHHTYLPLKVKYQIYSQTNQLDRILSCPLMSQYFRIA